MMHDVPGDMNKASLWRQRLTKNQTEEAAKLAILVHSLQAPLSLPLSFSHLSLSSLSHSLTRPFSLSPIHSKTRYVSYDLAIRQHCINYTYAHALKYYTIFTRKRLSWNVQYNIIYIFICTTPLYYVIGFCPSPSLSFPSNQQVRLFYISGDNGRYGNLKNIYIYIFICIYTRDSLISQESQSKVRKKRHGNKKHLIKSSGSIWIYLQ